METENPAFALKLDFFARLRYPMKWLEKFVINSRKKGEKLVKLGKNESKTPRTANTARYKRRLEEKQKKASKSFINVLKQVNLKKINIKAPLLRGVNVLKKGARHLGEEMLSIIKEAVPMIGAKNRKSVVFGISIMLLIFVSYSVVNTLFPSTAMGEEAPWIVVGSSGEDVTIDTNRGSALLESIMEGPEELAGVSDIKAIVKANLVKQEALLREKLQKETELSKMINPVMGCQIFVNGKIIAVMDSKASAEQLLTGIKASYYKTDNPNVKFLGYGEDVQLVETHVEKGAIMNLEDANKMVMYGGQEVKIHVVESGDNIWLIARENNMRVKDLALANPGMNLDLIHIGDKIQLVMVKPLISIKTQETLTLNEQIPYGQKVAESKSLYKDQQKITVKGVPGQRIITADVVKINGQIVTKTVLTENIVKQPKTQYVVKGTKAIPSSFGSLAFKMPLYGGINTYFGARGSLWGRERHRGLDIKGDTGEPISAADSGKVVKTGYNGRSGNFIEIDHGRGYVTFYAHLSKIGVRQGQNVAKGQYIGKVGNTGHSTGSHLHFELRINNTPVNPLKYVR